MCATPKLAFWTDKSVCFAMVRRSVDNARLTPWTSTVKLRLWLAFLTASIFVHPALALDIVPYEAQGFAKAQAAGKVVAIQFHSGWCPVCVMQERGVKAIKDEKPLADVTVFQADYFKEEALRKRFGVTSFSTLVVFRGEAERSRTTGDFRPEQLRDLFAKAL
jgi:thiol-disulfide isomerase/thioredoxin